MAILTTVGQGDSKFYEVPDDQLSKFELKAEKKEDAGNETPEGKMPAALMSGGDVQAYSGDICWIRRGGILYWWYC
ncbi:MAG TPA: hypothetical protein VF708_21990 [Pyrinomonadaceae bacterium]|jgi:hypothetical protein